MRWTSRSRPGPQLVQVERLLCAKRDEGQQQDMAKSGPRTILMQVQNDKNKIKKDKKGKKRHFRLVVWLPRCVIAVHRKGRSRTRSMLCMDGCVRMYSLLDVHRLYVGRSGPTALRPSCPPRTIVQLELQLLKSQAEGRSEGGVFFFLSPWRSVVNRINIQHGRYPWPPGASV